MHAMNCVIVASLVAILFVSAETKLAVRRQRSTRSPCEAVTKRINYDTATTYDGESVSVHERDGSMETTSCAHENSKCDGVVESIDSFCKTEYGLRPAMVRVSIESGFVWNREMIKVPTACSCYVNATQLDGY